MQKIKNYDILDIVKFILSIMVVAIHTELFPTVLFPWLRIAIPLFFIISSFLLYEKIKLNKENKKEIIKKYIVRQLKYYLFWFIVLIPATVYLRKEWFSEGIWYGIIRIISNLLLSGTFFASWYITATILGTLIINWLSKYLNNKKMFILFVISFAICCLISSYSFLFKNVDGLSEFCKYYELIFTSPIHSYPAALIWILIGKVFSDNLDKVKEKYKRYRVLQYILLAISLGALYIEWRITSSYTGVYSNDWLFLLLPSVVLIFSILLNIDISTIHGKTLRKMSIIIYPLHASSSMAIGFLIKKFINLPDSIYSLTKFAVTICFCLAVCFLIFKFENKKHFKWLKYSH